MVQQNLTEFGRTVELRSVGKFRPRVHCGAGCISDSPLAARVKILQREPQLVHLGMTTGADGDGAMLGHPLLHREHFARVPFVLELRYVRRRRRWRSAENIL